MLGMSRSECAEIGVAEDSPVKVDSKKPEGLIWDGRPQSAASTSSDRSDDMMAGMDPRSWTNCGGDATFLRFCPLVLSLMSTSGSARQRLCMVMIPPFCKKKLMYCFCSS